jgi:hypothetical protein
MIYLATKACRMKEKRKRGLPLHIRALQSCFEYLSLGIAGLALCLFALGAVIVGAGLLVQQIQFSTSGISVSATVTDCTHEAVAEGRRKTHLTYQYTVQDTPYHTTTTVWVACADYPVGATIEVRYLPSDPAQSQISTSAVKSQVADWLTALMLLFVGLGGLGGVLGLVLTYFSVEYEAIWRRKRAA